ncbi:TPA: amino acid ABC transporter permease [Streptococcus pneumoniae]
MSYLFEILPSLLNGASTTVQVFALVLLFSIPLGVLIAFALQVHWKPLHYLINIYIVLNYAAYFAEIFRGGIDTIPRGQYEAAKVLKFSPFDRVRYIILPQVTKIVLPSVFNEVMSLVKDTSLVYALGISDLILASRTAANRDASLVPMFLAGAIYLILIGIVTIISKKVEKKYSYYR